MKNKILLLLFCVNFVILAACSSSGRDTGFTHTGAFKFTYDEFVELYDTHFITPFSVEDSYTYDGLNIEAHYIDRRNLYFELFLDNDLIYEIYVSFLNDFTEETFDLLYGLLTIIDLPYDIDEFNNTITEMQNSDKYSKILNFGEMWLFFDKYESYQSQIKHTISFYPSPR